MIAVAADDEEAPFVSSRPIRHRVEELSARVAAGRADAKLLRDLDDALSEGYALALALDGKRLRLDRRIAKLAEAIDDAAAARELRALALERRAVAREADELRERLGCLRREFVRLGGTRLTR